jgi:hypothetical protein
VAWLDDRIWCHPKFADLTDHAFTAYIKGIAYSSGFSTKGHLTAGQLKTIGIDGRAKKELIAAELWHLNGDGKSIDIHDYAEHNEKREARREKERERLRARRQNEGQTA